MPQHAPKHPSVQKLQSLFPINTVTISNIALTRRLIGSVINRGNHTGLLGIIGPCAATLETDNTGTMVAEMEGVTLANSQDADHGLILAHRLPVWKPRSNPDDWHGIESEQETVLPAYELIARCANKTANVAIEIGHEYHIDRYGKWLSFAWIGGRNVDNKRLVELAAAQLPELPLGIKNGLDGELDVALKNVSNVRKIRGANAAPVILIYRGGENAQNPKDWEVQYRRALEKTNGNLIVDTAHGGEMAHDPAGTFTKSVEGQLACLSAVISIGERHGECPQGIMIEASSAQSPTDPVVPLVGALQEIRRLHKLRQSYQGVS